MVIKSDKFNSEIFGVNWGNIILSNNEVIDFGSIRNMEKAASSDGYNYLSIKIPTTEKRTVNSFLSSGYYLVDTLITYYYPASKKLRDVEDLCILRDCRDCDLNEIKRIAHNSFKQDRFHSDPNLSDVLCDRYYEKWVENSYHGLSERTIVAEYQGHVAGFLTVTTSKNESDLKRYGHIVLVAVDEPFRGKKINTSMIHEGVQWMIGHHPDLVGILAGTQIEVKGSQRTWISLGFTAYDSMYVLHKNLSERN